MAAAATPEKLGCRREPCRVYWLVGSVDNRPEAVVGCERLERLLARMEIHEVANRNELLGDTGGLVAMFDENEAIGFRVRERTQQDGVHHGEHGHVGANPQCQSEHSGRREDGIGRSWRSA